MHNVSHSIHCSASPRGLGSALSDVSSTRDSLISSVTQGGVTNKDQTLFPLSLSPFGKDGPAQPDPKVTGLDSFHLAAVVVGGERPDSQGLSLSASLWHHGQPTGTRTTVGPTCLSLSLHPSPSVPDHLPRLGAKSKKKRRPTGDQDPSSASLSSPPRSSSLTSSSHQSSSSQPHVHCPCQQVW